MSTVAGSNPLEAFQWQQQPQAEKLARRLVGQFVEKNGFAKTFAQKLHDEAGVRFVDMVDDLRVAASDALRDELKSAGFQKQPGTSGPEWFTHPGGMFPAILLDGARETRLSIKVEFVADFAATWDLPASGIEGEPTAPMRRTVVSKDADSVLVAVERHGYRGLDVPKWSAQKSALVLKHREAFRTRRRNFDNDTDGFAEAHRLIDASIQDLGVDYTCDLFFAAEREYWMRRNHAARVQKARQDRLGIGWANHDHHTYRSSREHFAALIGLHEKLGLVCRERFYAGREAGWGAQVMEQPVTGIITFNDVDLSPEELMGDFSHDGLKPRDKLGTVGLWCALHGEAILQAGMHHLEAQFDFDALRDQLAEDGVKIMKPFTNFTFLRQAFTEGERWSVDPKRIDRALQRGYITPQQAQQFREQGAIGSHLENLERNEGFKGFNQTGVSEIISATDPRKQLKAATH
jgi:hypothetical protein